MRQLEWILERHTRGQQFEVLFPLFCLCRFVLFCFFFPFRSCTFKLFNFYPSDFKLFAFYDYFALYIWREWKPYLLLLSIRLRFFFFVTLIPSAAILFLLLLFTLYHVAKFQKQKFNHPISGSDSTAFQPCHYHPLSIIIIIVNWKHCVPVYALEWSGVWDFLWRIHLVLH